MSCRSIIVRSSRPSCIRRWKPGVRRWLSAHWHGSAQAELVSVPGWRWVCANGVSMIALEAAVHILDLGGTFVFAISGAVAAVERRLDIFGVLVLSFVAGNFGGITRDLLIGAVPPAAIGNWRYLAVSLLAGAV